MSLQTAENTAYTAVGRRKNATARVRLKPGSGKITVNNKDLETYFFSEKLSRTATQPLYTVERREEFDLVISTRGGGMQGQAGAVSLGIARALEKFNPELRVPLKKAGHMTRDPRMKERKKSGQPGARKRFQFSKR